MITREETLEELDQVLAFIRDPANNVTPYLSCNGNGDTDVQFETWETWSVYDRVLWTLTDLFAIVADTDDIITPSAYAKYRAADLFEDYTRKEYYKAMDVKNKFADLWLNATNVHE